MIYNNTLFTPIKGYTDYYISRKTTEVLSTKPTRNSVDGSIRILKQVPNSKKDPYYIVTLVSPEGLQGNAFIHRIMAQTFLPNPSNKPQVNHIDGDKNNNCLSNLEWATAAENSQHAVDTKLTTYEHCEKEVHQYTLAGNYIATFKSDAAAEKSTNAAKQNISKVTLGQRPQAGGYMWTRHRQQRIPKYTGKPIVKCFTVHDTTTGTVTVHKPNVRSLAEEYALNYKNLAYKLRLNGEFVTDTYTISRTFFD